MSAKFGVVLRLELVPAGKKSGEGVFPTQEVYFKVMPKGLSDFKGLLLGFPALDHKSRGMGYQSTERTHWMQKHDIHLPRVEIDRRTAKDKEFESWEKTGDYTSSSSIEGARRLSEFAHLGGVVAYYTEPDIVLAAGESMIVPVTWEGDRPEYDFLCDAPPNSKCSIVPGIVNNDAEEGKIWIVNESPLDVIIETGQVLAEEVPADEGEVLVRRGLHPETGAMPERLEVVDGLYRVRTYTDVEGERLASLSSKDGQSSAAGSSQGCSAASAIDLEYRGNEAFQKIEHLKPRTSLYIPSSSPRSLPAEFYTGGRMTVGHFIDTNESFQDDTPWRPGTKVEHHGLSRKWLGYTLLALTTMGQLYGRGFHGEGFCGFPGCTEKGKQGCRNRCIDSWFCELHSSPADHRCPGNHSVVCEDTSKDFRFSLNLPFKPLNGTKASEPSPDLVDELRKVGEENARGAVASKRRRPAAPRESAREREGERLASLSSKEGQSSAAGSSQGCSAASAIDLEYRGNEAFQKIEHLKPRTSLYIPSSSPRSLPAEFYTGGRMTVGHFIDTNESFQDDTPWRPGTKVEHHGLSRKWLGYTLLALTTMGQLYGRGFHGEGFCGFPGCTEKGKQGCRNRCIDSWFCELHSSPADHRCPGNHSVVCEDTSKDFRFSLNLPFKPLNGTKASEPSPDLVDELRKVGEENSPVDKVCHLVQEEDVIMRIHSEEIPPDIYYDKLKGILDDMFPGTSEGLLDHLIAFIAAGDTAAAFCVSFGIGKFQLAQPTTR